MKIAAIYYWCTTLLCTLALLAFAAGGESLYFIAAIFALPPIAGVIEDKLRKNNAALYTLGAIFSGMTAAATFFVVGLMPALVVLATGFSLTMAIKRTFLG